MSNQPDEKKEPKETFQVLRDELADYLRQAYTHKLLEDITKDLPMKLANEKLTGVPYSIWEVLEHIHQTQHDMLDFIRNPNYEELVWPDDYWPTPGTKADREMWRLTLEGYAQDVTALHDIIKDTSVDLFAPIPKATRGQTVFREIIQVIDHTSYHLGEIVILRRALGAWETDKH